MPKSDRNIEPADCCALANGCCRSKNTRAQLRPGIPEIEPPG